MGIAAIKFGVLLGTMIINTTVVDKTDDPMIDGGKINIPVVVYINGAINEHSATRFALEMTAAQKTGQPIIPVVISSYGGSVYAMFEMIDTINKIKKTMPVATIVVGKAMSAGAVLLSCGTEGMRYSAPLSTIMIHEVSSGTIGKTTEIKADAKETDRLNTMFIEIIALNIGKPRSYFLDIIHTKGHADWYLTPKDALEHGLINKIGVPDLNIKATVEITLE